MSGVLSMVCADYFPVKVYQNTLAGYGSDAQGLCYIRESLIAQICQAIIMQLLISFDVHCSKY